MKQTRHETTGYVYDGMKMVHSQIYLHNVTYKTYNFMPFHFITDSIRAADVATAVCVCVYTHLCLMSLCLQSAVICAVSLGFFQTIFLADITRKLPQVAARFTRLQPQSCTELPMRSASFHRSDLFGSP